MSDALEWAEGAGEWRKVKRTWRGVERGEWDCRVVTRWVESTGREDWMKTGKGQKGTGEEWRGAEGSTVEGRGLVGRIMDMT